MDLGFWGRVYFYPSRVNIQIFVFLNNFLQEINNFRASGGSGYKSTIVLIMFIANATDVKVASDWIHAFIPTLSGMAVVSHAKYLGILRLVSGERQWNFAVNTFRKTASQINDCHLSLHSAGM